jgi:hypothetical protein
MVKKLNAFEWSSYRAYAGLTPVPDWLHTTAILTFMPAGLGGGKPERYRQRFKDRLERGLGKGWKEGLAGDLMLGKKEFVEKVRKMPKGNRIEQKTLRALEEPPVDWIKSSRRLRNCGRNPGRRSVNAMGIRGGNWQCCLPGGMGV